MHKKKKKNEIKKLQLISRNTSFQFVEAYKTLRTNLNFMAETNNYKKIIITGAIPSEGKSNVAVNIAVSLAETNKKVLLIDADLRKPVLHTYLRLGRQAVGLTSVLSKASKFTDAVVTYKDLGIDVLVAGVIPPNPAELLGGANMEKLLKEIEDKYDYIILDTPPISFVTDAAVLGRLVDGAILVVRQNHATIDAAKSAKRNLETAGVKIIGAVLNDYNSKTNEKESDYNYGYYSE